MSNGTTTSTTTTSTTPALPELKGWLGRGVDLFEFNPFVKAPSVKGARILQQACLKDEVESGGIIQKRSFGRQGYDETYADSLSDITNKLTIEAGLKGSYSGVTGSVESKFGLSGQRIEKTHFLKISFNVSADGYNLSKDSDQLKDLLEPGFKTALAGWNVDKLFNEYGTHLMKEILVGGRAEYFCYSTDTTSISQTDFRAAAKLGYNQVGGSVEGSAAVDASQSAKLNLVQGSKTIATIGGNATSTAGLTGNKWDAWATSCDTKPAFLGFAENDGLIPIWDLAATAERRDAILQAYMKKAAKALRPHILSVTSDPAVSHPEARVTVPAGYKLVSGGARDNWHGAGNMLTASFPSSDNTWTAFGKDHKAGYADAATITVYAVAIYDPDDIWEVKVFSSGPTTKTTGWISRGVALEPGYVMVGGGAEVRYGNDTGTLLYASRPDGDNKWAAAAKDHEITSSATISAYAIGLRPNPNKVKGVKVLTKIAPPSTSGYSNRPEDTARPSEGYVMTGGGASLGWTGKAGLLLTASYPRDSNTWEGKGKDHVSGDSGFIEVYCIGVKVVDA